MPYENDNNNIFVFYLGVRNALIALEAFAP